MPEVDRRKRDADDSVGRAGDAAAWRPWMGALGRRVRRVREFLGLSQVELARRAGVSQGAISRFEAGRGLATPFLVVLKINIVLARALEQTDPAIRSDDVQRFLRHMDFLVAPAESGPLPEPGDVALSDLQLTPDPDLEELIACYRRLPETGRRAVMAAARTLAASPRT